MQLVCLDLEGVLVPEIWIAFAKEANIPELERTTRDEPDYDRLMRYRLDILQQHQLRLQDIQETIRKLDPLPGAIEFIQWLRAQTRLIILSDTFEQFAGPLMAKLSYPTLFCNELIVDEDGNITSYRLRQPDQKRAAVQALQTLHFSIVASGDSYNDVSMLETADRGIFFRPTEQMTKDYPVYPVAQNYQELRQHIEASWQSIEEK